jgi:VIT1/CCC1 family predicted Fe2+/Mn2+ transporter
MFGKLKGKKTYVAAALTVVGAAASYLTGDATAIQATQMATTAVLAACLRHGLG